MNIKTSESDMPILELANWSGFSGDFFKDAPLSDHTSYRVGGPCTFLVVPKSESDLAIIARIVRETRCKFAILGAGTNVLAPDAGFPGIVIKTSKLDRDIRLHDEIMNPATPSIVVGASVAISSLLGKASHFGWGGLEMLSGIPGSLGGCVFMNAGTHLGETGSRLLWVEVFKLNDANAHVERIPREQLRFSYRENLFLNEGDIVLRGALTIDPSDPAKVKSKIDGLLKRRKETQPVDLPSCGSVFRNPAPGQHAWQVIERLGLRGYKIGSAKFSEKHCNFIVNEGAAKAADVRALIELAKSLAREKLGVELKEEVRYLG